MLHLSRQVHTSSLLSTNKASTAKRSGSDLGFFLGGGAPLRNDVTDGEVKKF